MDRPLPVEHAGFTAELKAINADRREVMHTITTMSTDRIGDIVEPSGAQVDSFMRNPVVMVDHDYRVQNIVGRAVSLDVTKDAITARTQFTDSTPVARDAWNLVKAGMARAWSIGFKPVKHEAIKDKKGLLKGFRFTQWELLEYSLVAIPMNPDAVMEAVRRGIVGEESIKQLFRIESPAAVAAPPEATVDSPVVRPSYAALLIARAVQKARAAARLPLVDAITGRRKE